MKEPVPLPMAMPAKKTKSIIAILAVLEPSGDTSEMYAYKPETFTIKNLKSLKKFALKAAIEKLNA